MTLLSTLRPMIGQNEHTLISLTGGGGKTSLLKALAKNYATSGFSVLITTSTKIQSPRLFDFGQSVALYQESDALLHDPIKGEIVFFAVDHPMEMKKCQAPSLEIINHLKAKYDVVIVEADGAKCLPLKYHTERDPVIVSENDFTIAIMGLSAYGLDRDNVCFGLGESGKADIPFFQSLLDDGEGALKGIEPGKGLLLLNQGDLLIPSEMDAFASLKAPCPIIMGSVKEDFVYHVW